MNLPFSIADGLVFAGALAIAIGLAMVAIPLALTLGGAALGAFGFWLALTTDSAKEK